MTSVPNTTYGFRTWPYYFSNVRGPATRTGILRCSKYFPIHESLNFSSALRW